MIAYRISPGSPALMMIVAALFGCDDGRPGDSGPPDSAQDRSLQVPDGQVVDGDGQWTDQATCDKTLCGSDCVDLNTSCDHCGACGNACSPDEVCCNGQLVSRIGAAGSPLVSSGPCGILVYGRYANQGQTNKVHVLPDFSYAGYKGGGVPLPAAPVRRTVSPGAGDDRAAIQAAIDDVSQMSPAADGLRGAVLLKKGIYQVGDSLYIKTSGVVLRGEGQGAAGTVLLATKTSQHALIRIEGTGSGLGEVSGTRVDIADSYVPVGRRTFKVASAVKLSQGDVIVVLRTPNQAWIDALGMGQYGWTTSSYTIGHERKITAIDGDEITLDIPLVDTIEAKYGGGAVFKASIQGRIESCGVENLRLDSVYSSSTDEDHGWTGIRLGRTVSSWVRQVTVRHFGYEAVGITDEASFNTVEEVAMIDPVSQITGSRRYSFHVSDGVGNLFQRCYSRDGRHSFVSGARVTGPNVWLDCLAESCHNDDGPHHRWATGLLFDNTKGAELHVQNRTTSGTGHGWAGAQVLFYNAVATTDVICDAPTGAMNWAIGCKGTKAEGSWAPGEAFGWWESHGTPVSPRSLYLAQLKVRKGQAAVDSVTTAPQRKGTIWGMLGKWAGEGELAAYGPDPACKYGILSSNKTVCCAASCGACGGTGCSQLPGGADSCCTSNITAANQSCAKQPAPCVMP